MNRKPTTPRTAPQLLTVEAAAARLSVSDDFVRKLIAENQIAHVKIGDVTDKRAPLRIPEPALAAFVAARTIPAKAETHA
jgi:excisionase family DNA binding protein